MSDYIAINSWLTVRAKGATPLPPVELPYLVSVPQALLDRTPCHQEGDLVCETWHNKTWVNRTSYYSWKQDRWKWRAIPSVVAAREARKRKAQEEATGAGSMDYRGISKAMTDMDAKWDRAMKNWTEEEVGDLLGR